MRYLLYCDMDTVAADVETINQILNENVKSHVQINPCLWEFEVYEHAFSMDMKGVPEYLIDHLLGDFLNDNSIAFCANLEKIYFRLPDNDLPD